MVLLVVRGPVHGAPLHHLGQRRVQAFGECGGGGHVGQGGAGESCAKFAYCLTGTLIHRPLGIAVCHKLQTGVHDGCLCPNCSSKVSNDVAGRVVFGVLRGQGFRKFWEASFVRAVAHQAGRFDGQRGDNPHDSGAVGEDCGGLLPLNVLGGALALSLEPFLDPRGGGVVRIA